MTHFQLPETFDLFRPHTGHLAVVDPLPRCQLCETHMGIQRFARFDGLSKVHRQWANMCALHAGDHMTRTGYGIGQMLVLQAELDLCLINPNTNFQRLFYGLALVGPGGRVVHTTGEHCVGCGTEHSMPTLGTVYQF